MHLILGVRLYRGIGPASYCQVLSLIFYFLKNIRFRFCNIQKILHNAFQARYQAIDFTWLAVCLNKTFALVTILQVFEYQ
jgi:hypothetical protein